MISGEERGSALKEDEKGRVGIFPSWRSVYWTVVIYGVVVIAALALLSKILSFGAEQ